MPNENKVTNEIPINEPSSIETTTIEKTNTEDFTKSATAAKLSGVFHQATGLLKSKYGEFTNDEALVIAGSEQQLLGKVHRLVGKVRGVREATLKKIVDSRVESLALCRKHGGRIIDGASNIVDDVTKSLFK